MGTLEKTKYIHSAKPGYANLKEELLDLHNQVSSVPQEIADINTTLNGTKTDVDALKSLDLSNINGPLLAELIDARGPYTSVNERLQIMNAYTILNQIEKLSTNRHYGYDSEGFIVSETVTGDINATIIYKYDEFRNIIREERYDEKNNLTGYKDYQYDEFGQVTNVAGLNADDIAMASNSVLFRELDTRLKLIEAIDFVKLGKDIQGSDVALLLRKIQELLTRVTNLEDYLPGNQTQLIAIPSILDRLTELETRIHSAAMLYTFTVDSSKLTYDVPNTVTDKSAVYLEGLLLDCGEDYTIANGKLTFIIPLIDTFTVTCKY